MKKIVFYIVERPLSSANCSSEYNDEEIFENSGLAPIEVSFYILLTSILFSIVLIGHLLLFFKLTFSIYFFFQKKDIYSSLRHLLFSLY